MPVYKIDSLIEKAWQMFSAKAYVHQYTKYQIFIYLLLKFCLAHLQIVLVLKTAFL